MGHTPERTCIGCRLTGPAVELVRIVAPEGALAVVPTRGRPLVPLPLARGRGAWLHPRAECVAAALKTRAFSRAFRRQVDVGQPEWLLAQVRLAFGVSSHEQGDS